MEDLGLVMGEALAQAAGDKAGIRRYGNFLLPMDETLVMIALDLSGRPGLYYDVTPPSPSSSTEIVLTVVLPSAGNTPCQLKSCKRFTARA